MINPEIKGKAIIVPEDPVEFARKFFLEVARTAIDETGMFTVALSGGSTPKALYKALKECKDVIDWSKVLIFFSDERTVGPEDADSNYHMAMTSGFKALAVPQNQIFRMKGEVDAKKGALEYESKVKEHVRNESFDLILLGMGDDGHTASLFPGTKALTEIKRLVVENAVPQKETTRITFTYPLLRKAKNIMFLAVGEAKAEMVKKVLNDKKHQYPAGEVTSDHSKVLWILDKGSSKNL
ncbi:MAG: 6-phosphogluconolactonase [Chlamydiia bacterium]|nr:6-phosphogluconolactonase [Chlamydiia bacterium]MCH9618032.1 6-phosphogluconolactonase [Chlamydiia bacterium]MCH9623643.1 6-phosphogluconolactonase [Chlamydiia bacterium]